MISAATTEIVTLIANVSLALSLVVAVIFGISQAQAAARDRRDRLTLETLRNFSGREFAELLFHVNNHDLPATGAALRALPDDQQVLFIQMAQQMEALGLLVAEGLINVDLVDKTLGDFVVTAWAKFRPSFLDMRVNNPDPFLGEYFQWLAELLDKRMRDNPRQPFYQTGTPQ